MLRGIELLNILDYYFLLSFFVVTVAAASGLVLHMLFFKIRHFKQSRDLADKFKRREVKGNLVHCGKCYLWIDDMVYPVDLNCGEAATNIGDMTPGSKTDFLISRETTRLRESKKELRALLVYPRFLIVTFFVLVILRYVLFQSLNIYYLLLIFAALFLLLFYELFVVRFLVRQYIGLKFRIVACDANTEDLVALVKRYADTVIRKTDKDEFEIVVQDARVARSILEEIMGKDKCCTVL